MKFLRNDGGVASPKVELPHVEWQAILYKSNQIQHSSAEGICFAGIVATKERQRSLGGGSQSSTRNLPLQSVRHLGSALFS
jgi:hypothetical protein